MSDNRLELLDGGLQDNAVVFVAAATNVLEIVLKNEDGNKFAFINDKQIRQLMDWLNRNFDPQE